MKNQNVQKSYGAFESKDDFENIATSLIEATHEGNTLIEQDPTKVKHMIKTDLRDAIPPQLYALIGKVTTAIESLEKKQDSTK